MSTLQPYHITKEKLTVVSKNDIGARITLSIAA